MTDHHEACSELLYDFVAGSLSSEQRQFVEEHLAGCAECAAELRAVRAMNTSASDEAPLSDLERARLHRTVDRELFVTTSPARASMGSKIMPLLGAAALVAALGIFATNVDLGGMGGDDEAASGMAAGGGEAQDPAALLERGGPPIASVRGARAVPSLEQDSEVTIASGETADAAGAGEGSDAGTTEDSAALEEGAGAYSEPPNPRFTIEGGRFNRKDVARFGRTQEPFTTFARAYAPADVPELQVLYAAAIASAGETDQERSAIETCSSQVLSQALPVLPAFGAYGRLQGQDVLLLGFVFASSEGSPALDRYMLWAWPRTSCEVPMAAISGKIR